MNGDDATSIAAIGVFSAASFRERRTSARATWLHAHHDGLGFLVRFVIATTGDEQQRNSSILDEAFAFGDMVLLQTNITTRDWGPYLLMYEWLRHATTALPFRHASFVAKLDDDGYIHLPELALHLQSIQRAALPNVFYGNIMWTSWHMRNHHHIGSSQYPQNANRMFMGSQGPHQACGNHSCARPFPYATAPFQCLGHDLAKALATSERAAASVRSTREAMMQPGPKRGPPLFEDAWLGFAVQSLLPPRWHGHVTIVRLHKSFVFDHYGLKLDNFTCLVHDWSKHPIRMRWVHRYSTSHHCQSNASLECLAVTFQTNGYLATAGGWGGRYGIECSLRPFNHSCHVTVADLLKLYGKEEVNRTSRLGSAR